MSGEYEASSGGNDALRDQVDSLLEIFEQQRRELADVQGRLAEMTGQAWSADNLVRVTANVAGIPVQVHLVPEAFKRSTPEKLARSMVEAAQAAARAASEQSQQAFAAITDMAGDLPDLPDLVPGAPSIEELLTPPPVESLSEPTNASPPPSIPPGVPSSSSPGVPSSVPPSSSPGRPTNPSPSSPEPSPDVWVPTDLEDEEDNYYRNRRYLGDR